MKQFDDTRVEPAADDDCLEALQEWLNAGCPMRPCQELVALQKVAECRERYILEAGDRAAIMRKASEAHDSRKAEGM